MGPDTSSSSGSQRDPNHTILSTKLSIPPRRPSIVRRPRLTALLNEGLQRGCKLTLVAAPAGFGKTTLLCEWVPHSERCVTWLSLDERDNDPTRFWTYVVRTVQRLEPDLGETALEMLRGHPLQSMPIESVLTTLVNSIAEFPDDFALVLEDYHLIEEQAIHDAMGFLLQHLPHNMHLVISTRVDPPLPLVRLRASGQLLELRESDLRFRDDETSAFLQTLMGLSVSEEQVTALQDRTEGWIAGLKLAALSMQRSNNVSEFIATLTGSHRHIVEYLSEEVLRSLPTEVHTFLLRTCVLDRLSAPLCNAVTEQTNSQATLEWLDRANLFVRPLDTGQRWYRYHPLFADVLRHELREAQPDLIPELHRRAARWYRAQEQTAEAASHAVATEDAEWAAQFVEQTADEIWMRGELHTLQHCLDTLSENVVRTRPKLCLYSAWMRLLEYRWDDAEHYVQAAEDIVHRRELSADADAELQGMIAAIRSSLAGVRGDASSTVALSLEAREQLPTDNLFWHTVAAMNLGMACDAAYDVAGAIEAYTDAAVTARKANNLFLVLAASWMVAQRQMIQGYLHRAAETYRRSLQFASEQGAASLPVAGFTHVALGGLLREWNDLQAAREQVERGLELGQRGSIFFVSAAGYGTLARVLAAQGDRDGARTTMQRAVDLIEDRPNFAPWIRANRARLSLTLGDVRAAGRWAQEYSEAGAAAGAPETPPYVLEFTDLTMARVYLAQGQPEIARALLERLQQAAEPGGRTGSLIEILALQALAYHAQGNTDTAISIVERALSLAEPEGYVRTFADEGKPMAELLQVGRIQFGRLRGYADMLLDQFDVQPDTVIPQPLVEPLTNRELEILRQIADGCSNQAIAGRLHITVGTVKWHVTRILSKLEARNRTEAVARAREHGLL